MAVHTFVFNQSFWESTAALRLAALWAVCQYALLSAAVRTVFPVLRVSPGISNRRRIDQKQCSRPPGTKKPPVSPGKTNGYKEENQWFASSKPNETENETETENVNETYVGPQAAHKHKLMI